MRYSILIVALTTTACAAAPGSATVPERQRDVIFDERVGTIRTEANPAARVVVIAATPDRTWNAIVESYALIGVEIKYLNRPAGELGNRDVTMSRRLRTGEVSRYLDCGTDPITGPQANSYPIRASLVTRMWPDGPGTKIETRFSGLMARGGGRATVHCSSTGALESLISTAVSKISTQSPT